MKYTALFLLLVASISFAGELTVMTINTEWFWDSDDDQDGRIAIGPVGEPPSKKAVKLEAYAIAMHIKHQNADIVGLTEIEGEGAANEILHYLGDEWTLVFEKGRDSYTGQDVGLLTTLDVVPNTASNYGNVDEGTVGSVSARPSKALKAQLEHNNEKILVVVTHLISKTSDNDTKRKAQARSIRHGIDDDIEKIDHVIVMGDLNDTPGSAPLRAIKGSGQTALIQPANVSGNDQDYSYTYNGRKQLIDHILISPSLNNSAQLKTIDLGPISDHRAVILSVDI